MIISAKRARLLSAESTKWVIKGDDVISHKIRVSVEGEIYPLKSNAEEVLSVQKYVGKDVDVTIKVDSRKENVSLRLDSIAESNGK